MKIYYALTPEEALQRTLKYSSSDYSCKGVHLSLEGLIDFLVDYDLLDTCKYYTVVDLRNFEVAEEVVPDPYYDMITVRTPFFSLR